ncbi:MULTISPECIES: TraR/DksA C4-type zinc finger protein [unclassified Leisingera]|uniref:TraR/DksA family transcriptional regulator n=1 Tax=unclassified Leisingera TaxID=2614906 RepID=UPI0021A3B60A|nr:MULTISPECIES: TraR/DksA C4-type zinc finger protein [unclassified Leisingera]UWQ29838.1 TraR/DksA C4-type zinc finger protein [Leisingera sp. M523]UWQ76043.1 TraR/DksA C4-type zinc finger protein [Leisingera sp. M658]
MDFSTRKQTLEVRRMQLAGTLANAGLAPDAMQMGSARQAGAGHAGSIAFPAKAGLEELRRIDAALARLREGSYGYCRICGDNIADDWLDLRPASPFCKSCAL